MPSAILYEGDMGAIMKLIEKMQREIENLNIALAVVASNVKQIPAVSAQVLARPVVNQPTVLSRNNAGANAEITSRDSHHKTEDFARDFPALNNENSSRSWATVVETSSSVPIHNRYAVLSDDGDGGLFTEGVQTNVHDSHHSNTSSSNNSAETETMMMMMIYVVVVVVDVKFCVASQVVCRLKTSVQRIGLSTKQFIVLIVSVLPWIMIIYASLYEA